MPVFDRLLGRRHTALVLRSLSLIVEGGKPISLGLGMLADHYPTFWFRRRLRGAAKYVRGGVDWIEALRRHGVIRARGRRRSGFGRISRKPGLGARGAGGNGRASTRHPDSDRDSDVLSNRCHHPGHGGVYPGDSLLSAAGQPDPKAGMNMILFDSRKFEGRRDTAGRPERFRVGASRAATAAARCSPRWASRRLCS